MVEPPALFTANCAANVSTALLCFLLLEALARAFVRIRRRGSVLATVRSTRLHVFRICVPTGTLIALLWRWWRRVFHTVQSGRNPESRMYRSPHSIANLA